MSESSASMRDQGARHLQAGNLPEALRCLQAAVIQDPQDARAHSYLGVAHARRGDMVSSIAALEQAAMLQPDDAAMRYNLALALHQAGRMPEAREELRRALELQPDHPGALDLQRRMDSPAPATPTGPPPGAVPTAPPTASGPGGWNPAAPAAAVPSSMNTPGLLGAPAMATAAGPPLTATAGAAAGVPVEGAAGYTMTAGEAPGLGRRLLRGWLWGMLYGHWWTVWSGVSLFLFNMGDIGQYGLEMAIMVILFGFLYAAMGSLTGIILAVANVDEDTGQWIGVGMGLLAMVARMYLFNLPFNPTGLIFFGFTGRFVGAGLAGRIQQPVK